MTKHRTTISLDEQLWERAKPILNESNDSLSSLVEEWLALYLQGRDVEKAIDQMREAAKDRAEELLDEKKSERMQRIDRILWENDFEVAFAWPDVKSEAKAVGMDKKALEEHANKVQRMIDSSGINPEELWC